MPKKRAKGITLSKVFWLRNSADVKLFREKLLTRQVGLCAVSKVKLVTGALDHDHLDGSVRGVLLNEVNLLEGKYLKLFKKMKLDINHDLSFPDFLINLGTYLKRESTTTLLHYRHMTDSRKKLSRLIKRDLILKLAQDFGIIADSGLLKLEIVQIYMTQWVKLQEK